MLRLDLPVSQDADPTPERLVLNKQLDVKTSLDESASHQ